MNNGLFTAMGHQDLNENSDVNKLQKKMFSGNVHAIHFVGSFRQILSSKWSCQRDVIFVHPGPTYMFYFMIVIWIF